MEARRQSLRSPITPEMKSEALRLVESLMDQICDRPDPFGEIKVNVTMNDITVQGTPIYKLRGCKAS